MVSLTRFIGMLMLATIVLTARAGQLQLPDNVRLYMEVGGFGEDGMLTRQGGELDPFTIYMGSNWSAVLDDLNRLAPSTKKKLLIAAACDSLSPPNYLLFLEKIVQLSKVGAMDPAMLRSILSPTKYKEGFLAYNYQNARVKGVLDYLLIAEGIDSVRKLEVKKILSGQAREEFLDYNAAYNSGSVFNIAIP